MKHVMFSMTLFTFLLIGCKESSNKTSNGTITTIFDDAAAQRVDSLFEYLVSSNNIGGISTLVYENGKEVFHTTAGYQNKDKDIPMARNTIVQIWSMTKPLVGTALMTLFEDGLFELDDSLAMYLPEFANMEVVTGVDDDGALLLEPVNRPILVRDITRHTTGLGRTEGLGPLLRAANLTDRNSNLAEMSKKLGDLPLAFQPGEKWAYGMSVDLQAALVEKLSGKPFYEYLKSEVLDPLGLEDTRYYIPPADQDRFSAMYRRSGEGELSQNDSTSWVANTQEWSLTMGGYGLTSTLDDYMTFARMLQNEGSLNGVQILKPETIKLMATNHLAESVTERMWLPDRGQVGFGIDFAVRLAPPVDADENFGVVGEFFWDGAASTLFWVDPTNDLTVVMLTQLFPYDQIKLHKRFRDAVYGGFNN